MSPISNFASAGSLGRLVPRASMSAVGVNLALACIESLLYGMFFVLAMTSLAVLVGRHSGTNRSSTYSVRSGCGTDRIWTSPLFVATMLLLATVTSHWLITVRRIFDAFLYFDGGRAPMEYYLTVEAPTQVIGTAFVVASVIVGDIILTYRIWTVWDRRWALIVFPTLCTLAYTALGISMVQLFASYAPMESIFMTAARRRVITTSALTLATNLYGTGTNDRIPDMDEQQSDEAQSHLWRRRAHRVALVIFIESAAFYTFWTLFFVVSFSANSLLEQFAFHCIPAATGISFMLIVVRVGLGFHWSQIAGAGAAVPRSASVCARQPSMRIGKPAPPPTFPARAITLNVTRTIEQETDYALRMTPELRQADAGEMC
ncbi:hypothetical protein C2E23DRAFT_869920 [Lenzites betulinus]|nr:hypothetical protein C2E23DRAFT_869920 [Lenzites betulinus]